MQWFYLGFWEPTFPTHLGKYLIKIGKIRAKIHEIGKIKAIFGLEMTPIYGLKNGQIKSLICNWCVRTAKQAKLLHTPSWWYMYVNYVMVCDNYITQTLIGRASHWLTLWLTLVPLRCTSNHVIVQCFASRDANICNVRFHLRQLQWKCKYLYLFQKMNICYLSFPDSNSGMSIVF